LKINRRRERRRLEPQDNNAIDLFFVVVRDDNDDEEDDVVAIESIISSDLGIFVINISISSSVPLQSRRILSSGNCNEIKGNANPNIWFATLSIDALARAR